MDSQALPGHRVRMARNSGKVPAAINSSTVHACARTEVDDVICVSNGLLVVLHHEDRVSSGLSFSRAASSCSLSRAMQANGRLIQHIQHSAQVGPELCREPDALAFPPGKSRHAPPQLQVAQTDLEQEIQSLADFRQNVARDGRGPAGDLRLPEQWLCAFHGQREEIVAGGPFRAGGGSVRRQGEPLVRSGFSRVPRSPGKARVFLPAIRTRIPRWRLRSRRGPHPAGRTVLQTPAFRAPPLGRVVAEVFRVQRRKERSHLGQDLSVECTRELSMLSRANNMPFPSSQGFLEQRVD